MRPLNDWVLVRVNPLPEKTFSDIFLVHGGNVRTAVVVEVGPGRRTSKGALVPTDLEVGDKVAYFRWNEEHKQGKQLTSVLATEDDSLFLVKASDILFTWTGEDPLIT